MGNCRSKITIVRIDKTELFSRCGERLPTFEKLATLANANAQCEGYPMHRVYTKMLNALLPSCIPLNTEH
jgi:hypothetical protein